MIPCKQYTSVTVMADEAPGSSNAESSIRTTPVISTVTTTTTTTSRYDGDDDDNDDGDCGTCNTQICRRIPCRARGHPQSHNEKTAYIQIPTNAPHGLLLVCSHSICRKSGRRFRYCKVCDCPAAKRNFHRRHSHGMRIPTAKEDAQNDVVPSATTLTSEDAKNDNRFSPRSSTTCSDNNKMTHGSQESHQVTLSDDGIMEHMKHGSSCSHATHDEVLHQLHDSGSLPFHCLDFEPVPISCSMTSQHSSSGGFRQTLTSNYVLTSEDKEWLSILRLPQSNNDDNKMQRGNQQGSLFTENALQSNQNSSDQHEQYSSLGGFSTKRMHRHSFIQGRTTMLQESHYCSRGCKRSAEIWDAPPKDDDDDECLRPFRLTSGAEHPFQHHPEKASRSHHHHHDHHHEKTCVNTKKKSMQSRAHDHYQNKPANSAQYRLSNSGTIGTPETIRWASCSSDISTLDDDHDDLIMIDDD